MSNGCEEKDMSFLMLLNVDSGEERCEECYMCLRVCRQKSIGLQERYNVQICSLSISFDTVTAISTNRNWFSFDSKSCTNRSKVSTR